MWPCLSASVETTPEVIWTLRTLFLGMGTTLEHFHAVGGWPDCIERLNGLVTEGAIAPAVYFNMRAEIPSWPLALAVLRDCNIYIQDLFLGTKDVGSVIQLGEITV